MASPDPRAQCLGVSPSKLSANDISFRRMLGLIRGRVYYNLESWYRTLALLPGFKVNRRDIVEGRREDLTALHFSLGQAF